MSRTPPTLWPVLAALYPGARDPNRLYNYKLHENTLNTSGLAFPMPVKDIPKFEKQNPSVSINVLCMSARNVTVAITSTSFYSKYQTIPATMCGSKTCPAWLPAERKLVTQPSFATIAYTPLVQSKSNCKRHPAQDVKYPDP